MTYAVGSPEWVAERQTYLGASEMAGALGLSPWDDPVSVWERKIGEAPEKPESFRMKLGTLIEPLIGQLAAEQLDARLHRWAGPIRHPAYPFLASNPDFRIVGGLKERKGRGLVQAKLRLDEPFGEPDDGAGAGIPLHYRLQGLGELLTTGYDFVYFAALNPREGVSLYPLDRRFSDNAAAIEDLEADCVEWWQSYVEPKRLPPPSSKSGEALRRRYPEAKLDVGKIASAEQAETLDEFLRLRDSEKAVKESKDEAAARIKAWIGDAKWIEGAGKRFSWPRFDVTKVAWEEVAAAYRQGIETLLGVLDRIIEDDPDDWAKVAQVREQLEVIPGLYTRTERSDGGVRVGEIK